MHRSFCIIFPATNMPEGWDIIHFKDEIHTSVLGGGGGQEIQKLGTELAK